MRAVATSLSMFFLLACSTAESEPLPDAGSDRFEGYGEPIEATAEEWTWVPFEESACGNGEPSGILVNPAVSATRVLLYLEGGGLCWDDFTCVQQETATYVQRGYNRVDAEDFAAVEGTLGIFNRQAEGNPFADHHFVYVPYCTGDLHAGSREETSYGVSHTGYENLGEFLHRIVPTFPDVEEVTVAGASAGGYGAMLNYDRTRRAFLDVPVHLLIDSAPPFTTELLPLAFQDVQRAAWNLDAAIPEGCESCDDLFATFSFLLGRWPDMRVGLVSSLEDSTMRFLIGLGLGDPNSISGAEYRAGLVELLDEAFARRAGAEMFLIPGAAHVFVYRDPLSGVVVDDLPLGAFLEGLVEGDGFRSAVP